MGGYGVLTEAGRPLDPQGGAVKFVPGGLLLPFARGGRAARLHTGQGTARRRGDFPRRRRRAGFLGRDGLRQTTAPLLLIAGDDDRTVLTTQPERVPFSTWPAGAHRYLLTFKGGGHAMGLNPAPESMRHLLWDQEWFEDPVWRKDRINAINAHFITAFLDLYLKGDETRCRLSRRARAAIGRGHVPAATPPLG